MSTNNNSLSNLGATASRILGAFELELEAVGVELPEARFVSPGADLAWDGEQLCVTLVDIDQGFPGLPEAGTVFPTVTTFAAQFAVMLIRVVPALSEDSRLPAMLPTPEEAQIAADRTINDAAMLAIAATNVHKAYTITGPGEGFHIGPIQPFGPEDGLVGTKCAITISVN